MYPWEFQYGIFQEYKDWNYESGNLLLFGIFGGVGDGLCDLPSGDVLPSPPVFAQNRRVIVVIRATLKIEAPVYGNLPGHLRLTIPVREALEAHHNIVTRITT